MQESCTVYRTLDIIGKKWVLLIIASIYKGDGTRRYSQIKKDLHLVTPKILSERLKELVAEGIIIKEIDNSTIPVKSYYSLTDSGKALVKLLQDIKKWGLKWKFKNKECAATLCRNCKL